MFHTQHHQRTYTTLLRFGSVTTRSVNVTVVVYLVYSRGDAFCFLSFYPFYSLLVPAATFPVPSPICPINQASEPGTPRGPPDSFCVVHF